MKRAFSSDAQSGGLLNRRSVVQVHERPPSALPVNDSAPTETRQFTDLHASLEGHLHDPEVQDILFSFLRLRDSALRRAAVHAVRGLAV